MKRTLVERVAKHLCYRYGFPNSEEYLSSIWKREARRLIAMVRRHDRQKGAKK